MLRRICRRTFAGITMAQRLFGVCTSAMNADPAGLVRRLDQHVDALASHQGLACVVGEAPVGAGLAGTVTLDHGVGLDVLDAHDLPGVLAALGAVEPQPLVDVQIELACPAVVEVVRVQVAGHRRLGHRMVRSQRRRDGRLADVALLAPRGMERTAQPEQHVALLRVQRRPRAIAEVGGEGLRGPPGRLGNGRAWHSLHILHRATGRHQHSFPRHILDVRGRVDPHRQISLQVAAADMAYQTGGTAGRGRPVRRGGFVAVPGSPGRTGPDARCGMPRSPTRATSFSSRAAPRVNLPLSTGAGVQT